MNKIMNQHPVNSPFKQAQVFNQQQVRRAFDRAADDYEKYAILQHEVCHRLLEKLDIVKISPERILDMGAGTGIAIPPLFTRYKKAQVVALDLSENMLKKCARHGGLFRSPHLVCADIEQLPFADNMFDLVFSSSSMQWCNDLNAAFLEAKRVLKPGGLFVFSIFGPDTLKELRHSWSKVDASNHVNSFIDMHDIGDALLQDGFAEPVMEAEVMTVTYASVDEIMHDLKAIGANIRGRVNDSESESSLSSNTIRRGMAGKGLGGKSALQAVRDNYEHFRQDNLLPASFEIIYGHAWKSVLPEDINNAGKTQTVEFYR
jgi:malonyl-CoA O-methyltransferase